MERGGKAGGTGSQGSRRAGGPSSHLRAAARRPGCRPAEDRAELLGSWLGPRPFPAGSGRQSVRAPAQVGAGPQARPHPRGLPATWEPPAPPRRLAMASAVSLGQPPASPTGNALPPSSRPAAWPASPHAPTSARTRCPVGEAALPGGPEDLRLRGSSPQVAHPDWSLLFFPPPRPVLANEMLAPQVPPTGEALLHCSPSAESGKARAAEGLVPWFCAAHTPPHWRRLTTPDPLPTCSTKR